MKANMWRKTPPTVEDVRQHQHWWNKSIDGAPHVMDFDIDEGQIVYVEGIGLEILDPSDWGEYWAPCIPPEECIDKDLKNG